MAPNGRIRIRIGKIFGGDFSTYLFHFLRILEKAKKVVENLQPSAGSDF